MPDKSNPWDTQTGKRKPFCLTRLGFVLFSTLIMALCWPLFYFLPWFGLALFATSYTLAAYFRMRDWPDQKAGITAILLLPIIIVIGLSSPQIGACLFLAIHAILLFKKGHTKSKTISFLKNEFRERLKLFTLKRQVKAKRRDDLIKQLESELQHKSE